MTCQRCKGFMMLGYGIDNESGTHYTYDYCLNCGHILFHETKQRVPRPEVKARRRTKQQILLEEVYCETK